MKSIKEHFQILCKSSSNVFTTQRKVFLNRGYTALPCRDGIGGEKKLALSSNKKKEGKAHFFGKRQQSLSHLCLLSKIHTTVKVFAPHRKTLTKEEDYSMTQSRRAIRTGAHLEDGVLK